MENSRRREELDIIVRQYEEMQDRVGVEALERSEVEASTKIDFLQLGDPTCRIRHTTPSRMLVAEKVGGNREIVGVIRGTIKTVILGTQTPKVGYLLGLHVSRYHRNSRVGFKLISEVERWFISEGVEYAYMATTIDNIPSINLFTKHCSYNKTTYTLDLLVQNTLAHPVKIPSTIKVFPLSLLDAQVLYPILFSTTDFFPTDDIGSILGKDSSQGTYLATPSDWIESESWPGVAHFLAHRPESWAILSAWNCDYKIEVYGVSRAKRVFEAVKRRVDSWFPRLKINSYQGVFKPFSVQFLYGLGGSGTRSIAVMEALWGFVHNIAKNRRFTLIIAEVAKNDPLKSGIRHNKNLSCDDIWFTKRLSGEGISDVTGTSIFVDPREF